MMSVFIYKFQTKSPNNLCEAISKSHDVQLFNINIQTELKTLELDTLNPDPLI